MVIYFWNIQRASNPNARTFEAGQRWGISMYYIDMWLTNGSFDVLVLAEVTQTGPSFANYINNFISTHHIAGYTATFEPVPGQKTDISSCSFLLVEILRLKILFRKYQKFATF